MLYFRIIAVAICVFLMSFSSQNVFAAGSGGYRDETPDAGAFGMGSAFVGEADTPAAVYYNPAGINQISRPEVTLGNATIAPRQSFSGSGTTQNERVNIYNVPDFYAVVPIIPNKLTIGVDGGSYWGLGENWASNGPLRYVTTQAALKDLDNSLVVAYQVTDQWSLAASLDNDYSKVDESKALNLGTGTDANVELRGSDDEVGYRIATMFKINDQNQIGLMYRSRMDQNYTGKAIFNNISPAGALAGIGIPGSSFITPVSVKSTLPQSVIVGYSFKPTTKWTINADLEWMDWSSTRTQTINYPNATQAQLSSFLQANGASTAEDWHSSFSEAVGTQYDVTDRFRVRLGYYHHDKVAPSINFTPLIPDSSSNGYTTGFGFDITKRLTIDVAYSFIAYQTRNVTNATLTTFGGVDGKYSQYTNIGMASLTYKF